jgi:hypothetical protein
VSSTSARLYYTADNRLYAQVKPERCFASAAEAETAGYHAGRGTRDMPVKPR